QAEDGIRDFHVTGVQTCALPIWDLHAGQPVRVAGPVPVLVVGAHDRQQGAQALDRSQDLLALARVFLHQRPLLRSEGVGRLQDRSEERRVGEEWVWEWTVLLS